MGKNNGEKLGVRISELLKLNELTQRELAEKVGVTEVSMSRYIKGKRVPKAYIITNIANAFHTTTDDLLGQNNDEDVDFEQAYSQVQRLIARNAKHWSNAQKTGLVSAMFGEDE